MRSLLIAALSFCVMFAGVADGAQALKRTVTGTKCMKTSSHNPVWKFVPDNQATSGNFELKWGKSSNNPSSTGVCPNTLALVVINVAGCPNQQGVVAGCPFYLPGIFFSFTTMTNGNGNIKIPLNGQDILNAGGNVAFQIFVADTQACIGQLGIIEIHGSDLCTVHDVNAAPIFACN